MKPGRADVARAAGRRAGCVDIVAHVLSLVLHHGALCEEGTHSELLEHGGLYARLHELQFTRTPTA